MLNSFCMNNPIFASVSVNIVYNLLFDNMNHLYFPQIYPSEYGIKRMKEEDMKGPPEMVKHGPVDEDNKMDTDEGEQYHREMLRKYQLQR